MAFYKKEVVHKTSSQNPSGGRNDVRVLEVRTSLIKILLKQVNKPTKLKKIYILNAFCVYSNNCTCTYVLGAFVLLWLLVWFYRDNLEITKVSEKHVFVTGCDSGFGHLLCKCLDKRGFRVLAGCLTEKGADDLKRATGPFLKTCILDVTSTASIQKALEWTKKEVGDKGAFQVRRRNQFLKHA